MIVQAKYRLPLDKDDNEKIAGTSLNALEVAKVEISRDFANHLKNHIAFSQKDDQPPFRDNIEREFTGELFVYAPNHIRHIIGMLNSMEPSATAMQRAIIKSIKYELLNK